MAEDRHISIGRMGESVAVGYLENRGFKIISRNYRKKWGELDIVAKKDRVIHFIEVKAGSWNMDDWPSEGDAIYRPEDHMHGEKCARMARAIQTFLAEKKIGSDTDWTADLVVVLLNTSNNRARIRVVPDILLNA